MVPSRMRYQRTEEDQDAESRARWDSLFIEEDRRQRALRRVEITYQDSDDELASPSSAYDRFLRIQGPDRILRMCNFSPLELERLWNTVESYVMSKWNIGRGKKSTHPPEDILFMSLGALKLCGSWDRISSLFDMDASPFQKMVKKFLTMLKPFLYETFVENEHTRWTMQKLLLSGNTFSNFPCARYATDVTFQQADKPTGNFNDSKKLYSGKHHLYVLKVEVSVLPTGAAIGCTEYEPGSIADVTIFRGNAVFHRSAMQKKPEEAELNDDGLLVESFPHDWAIFVDKGYQGLADEFRDVHPKKKTPRGPQLTLSESRIYDSISHDRVIVENFFGRMKTLWGVISHKWIWDRQSYNMFFGICLALTNYSVRCCPLRREDGETYHRYISRLQQIGADIDASAMEKRRVYNDKRLARLQLCPRPATRPRLIAGDNIRQFSINSNVLGSPSSTKFGSLLD